MVFKRLCILGNEWLKKCSRKDDVWWKMTAQDLTKALDETAQAGPAKKKPRHEGGGAAGGE